jgi:hypothetical protein
MAHSSKEPLGKKTPSSKSLNELMELLLKLNAKVREKISPRGKRDEARPENMEMVIIILNNPSESHPRPPRAGRAKPMKHAWIDRLCREIERGAGRKKASGSKE